MIFRDLLAFDDSRGDFYFPCVNFIRKPAQLKRNKAAVRKGMGFRFKLLYATAAREPLVHS